MRSADHRSKLNLQQATGKEAKAYPKRFKKSRCDEEQGAVCKQARERRKLRD